MRLLRYIILPALLLAPALSQGQQPQPRGGRPGARSPAAREPRGYPNLRAQAEAVAGAFDRRDFAKLVSLTYPKLVELLGGPERMTSTLSQQAKQMDDEGGPFPTTTVVGEPQKVVRIGRQLFAVVPTTLRIKVPEGVLVGGAFVLGISEDGGENWTFLDGTAAVRPEQMKVLLPQASGKLKFPEIKPPVLERGP